MPGSGQSKPASDAATGLPVDQIVCQAAEQTLFHIHAHLAIFVNGMARQVPAAMGIPAQAAHGPFIARAPVLTGCTPHAADGIIHIESPVQRTYSLGEFFDEWGQPLGPGRAGPAVDHHGGGQPDAGHAVERLVRDADTGDGAVPGGFT